MASDLKEIILILATITNHSGARWSSLIGGVSEAIESETLCSLAVPRGSNVLQSGERWTVSLTYNMTQTLIIRTKGPNSL